MESEPVVFVVDDDPRVCESVVASLWQRHVTVRCFSSAERFLDGFDRTRAGCLLVDIEADDLSSSELRERLDCEDVDLPMIVVGKSDEHGVANAVRAMRGGAVDFLTKPLTDRGIWRSIRKALKQRGRQEQPRLSK